MKSFTNCQFISYFFKHLVKLTMVYRIQQIQKFAVTMRVAPTVDHQYAMKVQEGKMLVVKKK